jgi:hypothetical protein
MNSVISIPGSMIATVENGRIVSYVFTIAANDAGYFGEACVTCEGDEISDDIFSDLVSNTISVSQDRKTAFISVELGS